MCRHTLNSLVPLVSVAVPSFAIDQLTKWLVERYIQQGSWYVIIDGILNLRHDRNSGAAFGIMPGQNLLLIGITVVAIGFIFFYYRQFQTNLWMRIALGFLLGGALGNFVDRLRLGEVVDFLQIGIQKAGLWWPTFNVADISICIGAGMLIIHLIRTRGEHENSNPSDG
ncbi:MAG: signal peptidase II [Candidatus Poribacteria bacterium]|nr:signal peptidase II [Candidatus Poribacteria bacterium]